MAVQVTEQAEGDEGALRGAGVAVSLVPAVGAAGALVVLMSARTVEGLRALAASWNGPVLVVGTAEEARAVIGGATEDVGVVGPGREDVGPAGPTSEGDGAAGPTSPLSLDHDRRVVGDGRAEVELTPLEYGFLQLLNAEPGRLCTFERLQEEVWGTPHIGDVAQVHSLVKRLRRKLRALDLPVRLQAVRGVGFRLVGLAPLRRVGA